MRLNSISRSISLQKIKNLTEPEFNERLNQSEELAELPSDRRKLLFQLIKGGYSISHLGRFDVEQFLLKNLENHVYDPTYSCIDFEKYSYEYDFAKNGHNMVKHGLSFSEVVSFSICFGSLSVRLPEDKEKRFVVFSDLRISEDGKLDMPPRNLKK